MSTAAERDTLIRELLLAELGHFEESVWRNEEVGEKRFTFFVTLATAVGAGLIAMWTATTPSLNHDQMHTVTTAASVTLFLFGLLSFYRMMYRDRVTAEYKQTTNYIRDTYRETFGEHCKELRAYELPLDRLRRKHRGHSDLKQRLRRIRQAGYTSTLAVLDGLLLSAVIVVAADWSVGDAAWPGALLAAALCYVGGRPYKDV